MIEVTTKSYDVTYYYKNGDIWESRNFHTKREIAAHVARTKRSARYHGDEVTRYEVTESAG